MQLKSFFGIFFGMYFEKDKALDALIFDFDGVIVDSEPIHMMGFQKILETVGITLTQEGYYQKYLGFDDHDCFETILQEHGQAADEKQIAELAAQKTIIVKKALRESISALPGSVELINSLAKTQIPLAICSGALREEIKIAAEAVGVLDRFKTIVSAEDVARGKPDPQGYVLAMDQLSQICEIDIYPAKCIAIEDSPMGIKSAKGARMKVLSVTNSYSAAELSQADRVVDSLASITPEQLDELL